IFAMACYIRSSHIVKILECRQSKRVDKQDGYYDPNGTIPLGLICQQYEGDNNIALSYST
ncbi:hypothetical protein ACRARJ_000407, partial [Yersinia enterocolitica]